MLPPPPAASAPALLCPHDSLHTYSLIRPAAFALPPPHLLAGPSPPPCLRPCAFCAGAWPTAGRGRSGLRWSAAPHMPLAATAGASRRRRACVLHSNVRRKKAQVDLGVGAALLLGNGQARRPAPCRQAWQAGSSAGGGACPPPTTTTRLPPRAAAVCPWAARCSLMPSSAAPAPSP